MFPVKQEDIKEEIDIPQDIDTYNDFSVYYKQEYQEDVEIKEENITDTDIKNEPTENQEITEETKQNNIDPPLKNRVKRMPGGIVCSIPSCKNNSKKARKNGEALMFITFPKDPKIRKEWIRKCKRKDKSWDAEHKRICSKHFKPEDFEDELRARLLNLKPKKLKKDAIPSLYLHSMDTKEKISEREQRIKKKERKEIIDALLNKPPTPPPILLKPIGPFKGPLPSPSILTKPIGPLSSPLILPKPIGPLKGPLEQSPILPKPIGPLKGPLPSQPPIPFLQVIIKQENFDGNIEIEETSSYTKEIIDFKALKNENMKLKKKIADLEQNEYDLKQQVLKLETQIKTEQKNFDQKIKNAFKGFLTSNQVDIVLKKKTSAHWTTEEFSKAITLRYLSKRAYVYLKETLKYPLPGLSTLERWSTNVNLTNGILEDVLPLMETAGKTKTNVSKITVLSFDELKMSSVYEYCQNQNGVMGPHSNMLVVMARGLFDNWKQPVYIGFDHRMTKDLLESLIVRLHKIEFNVVACVSDCGAGNQGLWKSFNVCMNNTSFEHPVTKKNVYFFADVPHLLKLLRNRFLDTGFVLSSGVRIFKDQVKCLIDNPDYKLTSLHINYETVRKQSVRLASELFSNTTAMDLKHYLANSDQILTEPAWVRDITEDIADFFELVNNWFDVMNSYSVESCVPSKRPYGVDLDAQNEVLDLMCSVIEGMLCVGRKTMQVFQRGIVMSSTSLKELYVNMKEEYGVESILTYRLNQDCLENLFTEIKTESGLHNHPSPMNAIQTIRSILLGKTHKQTTTTTSNKNVDNGLHDDHYLLASTLNQAQISKTTPQPETTQRENLILYNALNK